MKSALFAVFLMLVPTIAFADLSVIENNKTLTVECAKEGSVRLIGNHNTITLIGTCAKVTITGNHATVKGSASVIYVAGNNNTLAIDGVDEIAVAGNKNTLAYKSGLKGKLPTAIKNSGKDNKISHDKASAPK